MWIESKVREDGLNGNKTGNTSLMSDSSCHGSFCSSSCAWIICIKARVSHFSHLFRGVGMCLCVPVCVCVRVFFLVNVSVYAYKMLLYMYLCVSSVCICFYRQWLCVYLCLHVCCVYVCLSLSSMRLYPFSVTIQHDKQEVVRTEVIMLLRIRSLSILAY